jgi:hypothetical protein
VEEEEVVGLEKSEEESEDEEDTSGVVEEEKNTDEDEDARSLREELLGVVDVLTLTLVEVEAAVLLA